jgi:hypothetical protein
MGELAQFTGKGETQPVHGGIYNIIVTFTSNEILS